MKKYLSVCGTFARCVLPYFVVVLLGLLGLQYWSFRQEVMHPSVAGDPSMNEVFHGLQYILLRSVHLRFAPVLIAAALLLGTSAKNTRLTDTLDRLTISKNGVLTCQAICFTACFFTAHMALSTLLIILSGGYASSVMGVYAGPQTVIQEFFANSFLRNFIPMLEPWKYAANLAIDLLLGTTMACNSECMRRGRTPFSGLFLLLVMVIFYPKTDEGFGLGLVGMVLIQLYAFSEVGTARNDP